MKSNTIINLFSLTLIGLFLQLSLTVQANEKSYIFQNNTGRTVNDLHIIFTSGEVIYNSDSDDKKNIAARKAKHNVDRTDNKIHHFKFKGRRKRIANGDYVYIDFKTTADSEIKISSWYWTFNNTRVGDVKQGDANKAQQDEDLVEVSEDVVREFKFKNKIPKKKTGSKIEEYGINDLHIVVNQPVKVNNRTRDGEGADKKSGGVFEDTDVITCDCDGLAGNDHFNNRNENNSVRKQALKALGEPCASICKNTTEKRYVVQLATDKVIKTGDEIPIRLISPNDFDIIGKPWWTKDGHPITYDKDKNEDSRGSKENKPPKENEERDGISSEENEEEVFPVASILPDFANPNNKYNGFSFGFRVDFSKTPKEGLVPFIPASNAEVLSTPLNEETIYVDWGDDNNLERFLDQPVIQNVKQQPGLEANATFQNGVWAASLSGGHRKINIESKIENMTIHRVSEMFIEPVEGIISTEVEQFWLDFGVRRYFSNSRLQTFAEIGVIMNWFHTKKHDANFGSTGYSYEKCKWSTPWGVYSTAGLRYNWSDRFYSGVHAGFQMRTSGDKALIPGWKVSPEFGFGVGIRLNK